MVNIIRGLFILICVTAPIGVNAHEMTPTYVKLMPSYMVGIHKASVRLYNRRSDVNYYQIGVFDSEFKPLPFTSLYKIVKVKHLNEASIDIYIKDEVVHEVVYVCSESKLNKQVNVRTAVASRICSKVK
jgi:hypothetical protein